jgi:hypothetical protein
MKRSASSRRTNTRYRVANGLVGERLSSTTAYEHEVETLQRLESAVVHHLRRSRGSTP